MFNAVTASVLYKTIVVDRLEAFATGLPPTPHPQSTPQSTTSASAPVIGARKSLSKAQCLAYTRYLAIESHPSLISAARAPFAVETRKQVSLLLPKLQDAMRALAARHELAGRGKDGRGGVRMRHVCVNRFRQNSADLGGVWMEDYDLDAELVDMVHRIGPEVVCFYGRGVGQIRQPLCSRPCFVTHGASPIASSQSESQAHPAKKEGAVSQDRRERDTAMPKPIADHPTPTHWTAHYGAEPAPLFLYSILRIPVVHLVPTAHLRTFDPEAERVALESRSTWRLALFFLAELRAAMATYGIHHRDAQDKERCRHVWVIHPPMPRMEGGARDEQNGKSDQLEAAGAGSESEAGHNADGRQETSRVMEPFVTDWENVSKACIKASQQIGAGAGVEHEIRMESLPETEFGAEHITAERNSAPEKAAQSDNPLACPCAWYCDA